MATCKSDLLRKWLQGGVVGRVLGEHGGVCTKVARRGESELFGLNGGDCQALPLAVGDAGPGVANPMGARGLQSERRGDRRTLSSACGSGIAHLKACRGGDGEPAVLAVGECGGTTE